MKRKRLFILVAVVLFLGSLWLFIHTPMPITSSDSALNVANSRLQRTMWMHLSPRRWLILRKQLGKDHHYNLEIHPFSKDDQRAAVNPECLYVYGSMSDIAKCKEPMWMVSFATDLMTNSTQFFVLRARNGEFVAIYFWPGI
jgi:hypothetical protein